jgi:hypothetical protein
MPVANELLAALFVSEQWTYRHAALLTISAMAEGCLEEMHEILPQIVRYVPDPRPCRQDHSHARASTWAYSRIVAFADDPHPRVRHALCNCIGQLCYDFAVCPAHVAQATARPRLSLWCAHTHTHTAPVPASLRQPDHALPAQAAQRRGQPAVCDPTLPWGARPRD